MAGEFNGILSAAIDRALQVSQAPGRARSTRAVRWHPLFWTSAWRSNSSNALILVKVGRCRRRSQPAAIPFLDPSITRRGIGRK